MIKDLYINEKLFVSLNQDKISPILIGEQYKATGPKELKSESYSFIKKYPNIIEKLKEGNIIESYKDHDIVKTLLGVPGPKNIYEKDSHIIEISKSEGYTFEESIENLEFSLYKPQKKKGRK